eukprot:scaffold145645_cov32-Tisochrysis_lutea.AAC.4
MRHVTFRRDGSAVPAPPWHTAPARPYTHSLRSNARLGFGAHGRPTSHQDDDYGTCPDCQSAEAGCSNPLGPAPVARRRVCLCSLRTRPDPWYHANCTDSNANIHTSALIQHLRGFLGSRQLTISSILPSHALTPDHDSPPRPRIAQVKLLLTIVVLSMFLTPFLNEFGASIASRMEKGGGLVLQPDDDDDKVSLLIVLKSLKPQVEGGALVGKLFSLARNYPEPLLLHLSRVCQGEYVLVCGFGRVGQAVCELLTARLIRYKAFDMDPYRVAEARELGLPVSVRQC